MDLHAENPGMIHFSLEFIPANSGEGHGAMGSLARPDFESQSAIPFKPLRFSISGEGAKDLGTGDLGTQSSWTIFPTQVIFYLL